MPKVNLGTFTDTGRIDTPGLAVERLMVWAGSKEMDFTYGGAGSGVKKVEDDFVVTVWNEKANRFGSYLVTRDRQVKPYRP